jgi:hypothetical protein
MGHLNDLLFLSVNAGAHPPEFLLSAALLLATWLVPLAILVCCHHFKRVVFISNAPVLSWFRGS